jgi:hypothetical protein
MKTRRIRLWLDDEEEGDYGAPAWTISTEEVNEDGGVVIDNTLAAYGPESTRELREKGMDLYFEEALKEAVRIGRKERLPVYVYPADGGPARPA